MLQYVWDCLCWSMIVCPPIQIRFGGVSYPTLQHYFANSVCQASTSCEPWDMRYDMIWYERTLFWDTTLRHSGFENSTAYNWLLVIIQTLKWTDIIRHCFVEVMICFQNAHLMLFSNEVRVWQILTQVSHKLSCDRSCENVTSSSTTMTDIFKSEDVVKLLSGKTIVLLGE